MLDKKLLEKLQIYLEQGDVHNAFLYIKALEKQVPTIKPSRTNHLRKKDIENQAITSFKKVREQYNQLSSLNYVRSTYAEVARVSAAAQLLRYGAILMLAGLALLLGLDLPGTTILWGMGYTVVMAVAVGLSQWAGNRPAKMITDVVSGSIIAYNVYQNPTVALLEAVIVTGLMMCERWREKPLPLMLKASLIALYRIYTSLPTLTELESSEIVPELVPSSSSSIPVPVSGVSTNHSNMTSHFFNNNTAVQAGTLFVVPDYDHGNLEQAEAAQLNLLALCNKCIFIREGDCHKTEFQGKERYGFSEIPAAFRTDEPHILRLFIIFENENVLYPKMSDAVYTGSASLKIISIPTSLQECVSLDSYDRVNLETESVLYPLQGILENFIKQVGLLEQHCRQLLKKDFCHISNDEIKTFNDELSKYPVSRYADRFFKSSTKLYQQSYSTAQKLLMRSAIISLEENSARLSKSLKDSLEYSAISTELIAAYTKIGEISQALVSVAREKNDNAMMSAISDKLVQLKAGLDIFIRIGVSHLGDTELSRYLMKLIDEGVSVRLLDNAQPESKPFMPLKP